MACKCALFTFYVIDSSDGEKDCNGGTVFLALNVFVYQNIIPCLVIDS